MSLSLDIILLLVVAAILLVMVLRGYRRGFLKTVLSLVSILLSLFLVSYLQPTVLNVLRQATTLESFVSQTVEQGLEGEFRKAFLAGAEENAVAKQMTIDEEALQSVRLNKAQQLQLLGWMDFPEVLRQEVQTTVETTAGAFLRTITKTIVDTVMNTVSYLVTFVLVFVLIRILYAVFGIIGRVPVLHGINKTLGALVGLAEGVVIIWLLCLAVTAVFPSENGRKIMEAINGNALLSYIYNILYLVGNLFRK